MALDTTKVLPTGTVPFGQSVLQDSMQVNPLQLNGQIPVDTVTTNMAKTAGDANAVAQPDNTRKVVMPGNAQPQPVKTVKPAAPPAVQTVVGGTPAQQSAPAPVQAPAPAPQIVLTRNTPDTSDPTQTEQTGTEQALADKAEEQRRIRTVFQTITGKDSIPYGEKWRWYLQHGFTGMHGGLHNELMNQINAETQAFGNQASKTYGQELRAQEMKRRTLMNQWDKLLWEWNHGYYSGNEATVQEFYNRANNLKKAMIASGIEGDLIRDPSINAGGFAQGFQKNLAQTRDDLDWLGGWMKSIEDNIAADPNWVNDPQAQMEFDKMSEYVILKWAQSKGAIADAEKIRAQVEAMPAEDRKYYNAFTSLFFKGNTLMQLKAMGDAGNEHAKALVKEVERLVNYDPKNADDVVQVKDGKLQVMNQDRIAQLVALLQASVARDNLNLPIDLATALDSFKLSKEAFDDYIMKNANVDRRMVWNSAADQMRINLDKYRRNAPLLGLLKGWDYTGYVPNKELGDKLGEWQKAKGTDNVIKNARLTMPPINGDTSLGTGSLRVDPGAGGTTIDTEKPPAAIIDKNPVLVKDTWWYQKGNRMVKYGGK